LRLNQRIQEVMSTLLFSPKAIQASNPNRFTTAATAIEILLVFSGIMLYIWRWQFHHPHSWVWLLAAILLSHVVHRDRFGELGLGFTQMRASAEGILPLAVAIYLPLLIYFLAQGKLQLILPNQVALERFLEYGVWCLFQQYLLQSYFHRRLMRVARTPHLSAALVALMFGACHLPNAILTAVTTLGGYILAEVYTRHRNIWPLALAQTVGGFLVATLAPPALIHNMRVGPGYYIRIRR
jgi:hypothetical protein